ncbi:hypothetical protein [Clostridium lacusfryxellense]|uniref:hypothetical protein n=1 Tax=Clostridium lacusfryxellense TaxID=205328 RepID=UPI001C0D210D|nr:hypothetical protein [Clostridium lacusfryxellense]MBU3110297.1 hypothetical protein [Clostridium lacusfryxellense]
MSIGGILNSIHPEIAFSGWAVALIGLILTALLAPILKGLYKYIVSYKIIKRIEYEDLIKIKNSVVNFKIGLEYNQEFGIYIDKERNEKFCPTCLTDKGKKNHLSEETTQFGDKYKCPVCNQFFNNKEYRDRVEAKRAQVEAKRAQVQAMKNKRMNDILKLNKRS